MVPSSWLPVEKLLLVPLDPHDDQNHSRETGDFTLVLPHFDLQGLNRPSESGTFTGTKAFYLRREPQPDNSEQCRLSRPRTTEKIDLSFTIIVEHFET
jgi:hypothetical protein